MPHVLYALDEVEEIAHLAAGAASGVFLRARPDEVMPSGEVAEAVRNVIDAWHVEHGGTGRARVPHADGGTDEADNSAVVRVGDHEGRDRAPEAPRHEH